MAGESESVDQTSAMDVYIRLPHQPQQLLTISLPTGSRCRAVVDWLTDNVSAAHGGDFFLRQNGYCRLADDVVDPGATFDVSGRLRGGKGGFGSMLRAIGAQIEKTTNREACRDLTGRRLRAINDEKRFRLYARIKAEKEMEREERRRQKLETLATSKPRHEFDDVDYMKERRQIPERVEQAIEDAFAEDAGTSSGVKRSAEDNSSTTRPLKSPAPKKIKGDWMGELEGLESSDSETEDTLRSTSSKFDGSNISSNDIKMDTITQESTPKESCSVSTADQREDESSSTHDNGPKDSLKTMSEHQSRHATSTARNSDVVLETPNVTTQTTSDPTCLTTEPECSTLIEKTRPVSGDEVVHIDLSTIRCLEELVAAFTADQLKIELSRRGLKCGGTHRERAERLWAVKNLKPEDIPKKLLAPKVALER